VDAVIDLLDAGADHLVVVDPLRDVLGVLSAADLMGVETRSPFALRHAILRAADEEELVAAAQNLRRLFLALLDAGLASVDIGRVLSLQFDTFTIRLLDLAFEAHGPAPVPWAWLALGSVARRELTLGSDQENALAYADPNGDAEVDRYFERIATDVNRGIERLWLPTRPERSCRPQRTVADVRVHLGPGLPRLPGVAGQLPPDPGERLFRLPRDRRRARGERRSSWRSCGTRRTTRTSCAASRAARRISSRSSASAAPCPTRASTSRGAERSRSRISRASMPSRTASPSRAPSTASSRSQELGALEAETAAALREAFEIVARIRLDHHAACIAARRDPDNIIDPKDLPPLMRVHLREALRAVAAAQKQLGVYVPLGM